MAQQQPKPKKLTAPRRVVYSKDPALDDGDEAKLEKALAHTNKTGELAGLPLREGRTPVAWLVRSLTARAYLDLTRVSVQELVAIRRAADEQRLESALLARAFFSEALEAFRRGVVGADSAVDVNGDPIAFGEDDFEETPAGRRLTWETTERIFERYKQGLISEIGRQVLEACEVPPL